MNIKEKKKCLLKYNNWNRFIKKYSDLGEKQTKINIKKKHHAERKVEKTTIEFVKL